MMENQKFGKVITDYKARSIDEDRFFEILQKQIEVYENEKDVLLTLSDDIAAVRSKADLSRAIETAIKKLSSVKAYVVRVTNDDGCTTSPFIYHSMIPFSDREFKEIVAVNLNIKDGFQDKVLKNSGPMLFDIEEEVRRISAPRYVRFWYNKGFNKMIGVPLRTGNKDVGILFIVTDIVNMPLLKGVCAQISIAISNMIVNEQLIASKKMLAVGKSQLKEQINTICTDSPGLKKFCEGVRYLMLNSVVGCP
jgi:formate hydrogenlyase transcriptional activator